MENKKSWASRRFICIFLAGNFLFFCLFYLQPNLTPGLTTIVINDTESVAKG